MRTRSMSDSLDNLGESSNDVFKTPKKDLSKSSVTSNTLPPVPYSDGKQKIAEPLTNQQKPYICSVCRNSESLRSVLLDTSTSTMLSKLQRANDSFSDSMDSVNKLSANLKHFLLFNSDKVESFLGNIKGSVSDLNKKSKAIEESILGHEKTLEAMQKSIAEFKKQPVHSINTGLNATGANHSESEFSVNRFNERVINNINQLVTNPTNYMDDYKENFLPNELRSSVCEYLDSCESYNDKTTSKVLYFGRPHKYTRAHNQKTQSEIPARFQSIIDMIHLKYYSDKDPSHPKLNSVVVNRYQGPKSYLLKHSDDDASISPESSIFTLSLGDTCAVTFTDKCTGNETNIDASDNSLFTISRNTTGSIILLNPLYQTRQSDIVYHFDRLIGVTKILP